MLNYLVFISGVDPQEIDHDAKNRMQKHVVIVFLSARLRFNLKVMTVDLTDDFTASSSLSSLFF